LLLGCDLAKLDDFTLNLLTNDEVLAVNQDPLGHGAHRVLKRADQEIYTKLLEDGSLAIGLFNLYEDEETVSIHWSDLGLTGSQQVRDLWRQHDLGLLPDGLSARVPRHGCVLVTVTPSRK
jgi:alpha-galactosidase